jgi:hypothetical protein
VRPPFKTEIEALKLVPTIEAGEALDAWHERVAEWSRQFTQWHIEPYAAALRRAAAILDSKAPSNASNKQTDKAANGSSRADQNARMRTYMRERRARIRADASNADSASTISDKTPTQ